MVPKPSPFRPAVVRRLAVFLGLGLVTTIAVAWALGALVHVHPSSGRRDFAQRNRTPDESPGGYIIVSRWRKPGAALYESVIYTNPAATLADIMATPRDIPPERFGPGWARRLLLPWVFGEAAVPIGTDERMIGVRGWPMHALRCSFVQTGTSPTPPFTIIEVRGGIALPFIKPPMPMFSADPPPVALPCTPIWHGLAADTAFYAGAWWIILGLSGLIRRSARRRRGRCPTCGYDLQRDLAGGCPECGWGRGGS